MICSCSDETPCHIGDGGDSTSHGVCRQIDDCGIDGDSISRGVGGLDDNRVYGDSVSGSVGSLERCIHTIDTSLSTWLQESRDSLTAFAKNIKEGDIIYWDHDDQEREMAWSKRREGVD